MEKREDNLKSSGSEQEPKNRRNFLKQGLMAASGLTFGYSLIRDVWAGNTPTMPAKNLQVQTQTAGPLRSPGHFTFAQVKHSEAIQRIAPTLNDLLKNAGVQMDAAEMDALQKTFAERGTITIPGGDPRVASTISLGGSVTWK